MKKRIFTLNEPNAPRINPALAKEIGLNESLILLQIEFWISISNNERDGKRWTYQSVRDMQEKSFSFWSISTINRAVNKLIDEGYIIEGNFNKMKYDKTRWFALNFETLNELESISINGDDTGVFHNDTRSNHNDTRSIQNDTTIPEITTEITTEIKDSPDSAKAKYDDDSPYLKLAEYLYKRVKENNSKAPVPNFQGWADDIRKLVELDDNTVDEVKEVIDWCQSDDFWKNNVMSANKLRVQFPKLWGQGGFENKGSIGIENLWGD